MRGTGRRGLGLAALLALAGCGRDIGEHYLAGNGDAMLSGTRRFVGTVRGCGAETRAVLTLEGRHFAFAPSEGVEVIEGTRDGAALSGSWSAQAGAAGSPGKGGAAPAAAGRPPAVVWNFSGTLDGKEISGTLRKPDCTAQVALKLG